MDVTVTQDGLGTHLGWGHDGITPRMIDWFWSNMEKGFLLWHPSEHEPLSWAVPVRSGNLVGAVHHAPQTWSDGTFRNIYIRFEDPARCFAEGGAIEALIEARTAGKVRFIGFTGHKDPDIHLAMLAAADAHGFTFDAVQMPLNVLDAHFRSFEKKVLPVLVARGIAVLGMKPLAAASSRRRAASPPPSAFATPSACRPAWSSPASTR